MAIKVVKFQTGKYDKPYLGHFSEKITSNNKFTSKKIGFRNTKITDIEISLGQKKKSLTEILMKQRRM